MVGVVDCPVVGVECFSLREWVVHKAFFDVPKVIVEKMNISVHVVSPMARNKNPIFRKLHLRWKLPHQPSHAWTRWCNFPKHRVINYMVINALVCKGYRLSRAVSFVPKKIYMFLNVAYCWNEFNICFSFCQAYFTN